MITDNLPCLSLQLQKTVYYHAPLRETYNYVEETFGAFNFLLTSKVSSSGFGIDVSS